MMSDPPTEELVTDDWRLHGSIYRSAEIFRREQEVIFRTAWLYVAHESEIAQPGDYKTTYAGTQPVIVSRGADDGAVHVLLNRCRHRAARVCHDESGSAHFFRCPYHGWTYHNTGALRGITYDDGYEDLDRSGLGLAALPRVACFAGFIFASFTADGPSLTEYLGNAAPYLQRVAAQHPAGIRLGAGAHQMTYPGNWKLQVENSIDGYHFSFVHRSFMEVVADRSGSATSLQDLASAGDVSVIDLGGGHAVADRGDATQGTLGGIPFNLNVFPNLCVLGLQVRHVIPKSVARTEVCLYPMLHAGASAEHNASILRAHEDFNGPAGAGTADDMEIAFFRVGDGLEATENDWLVLSRGLHRERPGENGVLIGHSSDEVAQRAFYRRWRQLMGGRT
jgi:nitrite reductase/ring-hydroxylating ferredoxin subunit